MDCCTDLAGHARPSLMEKDEEKKVHQQTEYSWPVCGDPSTPRLEDIVENYSVSHARILYRGTHAA